MLSVDLPLSPFLFYSGFFRSSHSFPLCGLSVFHVTSLRSPFCLSFSLSLPLCIDLFLSCTLPLRSSPLFPSLAYTLAPLFLPTTARLPSSFHPSNFSTPFTKIKINSGTTYPGTMPETPLPSSAAAYRRLQKAYTMLVYIDISRSRARTPRT